MEMPGANTGMGQGIMMKPWLHFTSGDYILFQSWRPVSISSILGTCAGLLLLAVFDRWLAATRHMLERCWHHKALTSNQQRPLLSGKKRPGVQDVPKRMIPPFFLTYDLPRGLLYAVQSLLTFILMLSVMTFNLAYLISIVIGLGAGEMIFGRTA